MLLKVKLGILIEEGPSIGTTLPEVGLHRACGLLFKVLIALLENEDCLLRIHMGDNQIGDQLLLKVLMVEEVCNLEKVEDVDWVD